MNAETRNAALAAALIMLGAGILFYVAPTIVIWVAERTSMWGGVAVAFAMILGFFGIFWLRGRYQRRDRRGPDGT